MRCKRQKEQIKIKEGQKILQLNLLGKRANPFQKDILVWELFLPEEGPEKRAILLEVAVLNNKTPKQGLEKVWIDCLLQNGGKDARTKNLRRSNLLETDGFRNTPGGTSHIESVSLGNGKGIVEEMDGFTIEHQGGEGAKSIALIATTNQGIQHVEKDTQIFLG